MTAWLAFLGGLLWDSIWLRVAWKILAPKVGWKKKGVATIKVKPRKRTIRLRPARIPKR